MCNARRVCSNRLQAKLQAKHQRMHGPLAPMCIFCGERFLEAFIRDEHVRKHTGEKPYLCKQSPACTKRYHSIKVREDHMKRAHTAVKAYTCHYCNKRFKTSDESRRHEGRHEGRRPIPCGFQGCDAAFANDYDARSHMNTIHENPHIKPCKGLDTPYTRSPHPFLYRADRSTTFFSFPPSFFSFPPSFFKRALPAAACHSTAKLRRTGWLTRSCSPAVVIAPLADKCPVCDRAFKDLQSQKRHLRTQHPEVWRESSGASLK